MGLDAAFQVAKSRNRKIKEYVLVAFIASAIVRTKADNYSSLIGIIARNVSSSSDSSSDFFRSTIARYALEIKNDPPLVHLIVQAASDIAKKYSATIIETLSKQEIPIISYLVDRSSERIVQNVTRERCQKCWKFRRVVAIFESPLDVQPDEWRIMYGELWNPSARFIIFLNECDDQEEKTPVYDRHKKIDELLRNFWTVDCANVVIACPESALNGTKSYGGRIYSYDPTIDETGSSNEGSENETETLSGSVYRVNDTKDTFLFPEKLRNLRGKMIAISLYPHKPRTDLAPSRSDEDVLKDSTGFDVEILRYAAKRLKFFISLKSDEADAFSHVTQLPCGRRVGPIGDVITKKTEYLANGQFLETFNLYNDSLDFFYPRWRSRSVVLVRREPPMPAALVRWTRPMRGTKGGFDEHLKRVLLLISGLLGLATVILYLRCFKRRSNGETFLALIGLALFQHMPRIGRLASERMFTVSWIYGSFVLSTVYQGSLVNDLTSAPIYDDIDTLEDLLERVDDLRLMVRPYERRILEKRVEASIGDDPRLERSLLERARVHLNLSACLALMRQSRSVACLTDESYGVYTLGQVRRYELMLQKNPHTRVVGMARNYLLPPVHILEQSLVTFWKTYFVRRDFPYLDMMDETVGRAFEFGLTEKWLRDDRDTSFREPEAFNEPRSLGLAHMDYTFGILAIGHLLAMLVFLTEILLFAVSKRLRARAIGAKVKLKEIRK